VRNELDLILFFDTKQKKRKRKKKVSSMIHKIHLCLDLSIVNTGLDRLIQWGCGS